jgi:4-amino-4-deoxy-L-arabinose transferase-like glycosyltransferase
VSPADGLQKVKKHAALAVLLVCAFIPRLTMLRQAAPADLPVHAETDERVFMTLMAQVRAHPLNYSLQGTPILRRLDPQNYDKPIFFHAPAFVYLGAALSALGLPLPLFPVLLELGAILCVYALALRLFGQREALWAAGLLATCTVTWFVGQHVWIDAMLVFSVALAMLLADRAGRRATPGAYAIAGGAFALAFLTKATAVLVAPALIALAMRNDAQALTPRKVVAALAAAAPPCLAWVAVLRMVNGQWLPSAFPTPEMMKQAPFVAMAVARPWHFYLSSLLLFAPVFAFALLRLRARDPRDLGPALCAIAFFVAMTVFGMNHGGYQTRYVAPAYPALAVLAGAAIAEFAAPGLIAVAALLGYGLLGAAEYAVFQTPRYADLAAPVASQFLRLFH